MKILSTPFFLLSINNRTLGYYHTDEHGNVAAISDGDRNVVADYDFDAFGNETVSTDSYYNPMRYCGEYSDVETGLIYLRARYYDPAIGRFISEDPIKDGTNWYVYCSNNPIAFVDPSGLELKFSDNATEEQKEQYNMAIEYLKTSEDGKTLIEKLENCDEVIIIEFTENYSESDPYWPLGITGDYTSTSMFVPQSGENGIDGIIFWNAHGGLKLKDGTSVQSPALQLAHEMGHSAQYIDGYMDDSLEDGTITNYEKFVIERENNMKYETVIAKQLGEPTRADYKDGIGIVGMNNTIHFRTTHNSMQGLKYTIDHNPYAHNGDKSTKIKNIV